MIKSVAVKLFVFHNVAVSKYLKPHPNIRGQISLTGAGIPFQAAIFAGKFGQKKSSRSWKPGRGDLIGWISLVILFLASTSGPAKAEGEEDDEELGTTKSNQCSQNQHLVVLHRVDKLVV